MKVKRRWFSNLFSEAIPAVRFKLSIQKQFCKATKEASFGRSFISAKISFCNLKAFLPSGLNFRLNNSQNFIT